jgi:hypothetical protein
MFDTNRWRCATHEGGHVLVGRLLGAKPVKVVLTTSGGTTSFSEPALEALSAHDAALVWAAGPAGELAALDPENDEFGFPTRRFLYRHKPPANAVLAPLPDLTALGKPTENDAPSDDERLAELADGDAATPEALQLILVHEPRFLRIARDLYKVGALSEADIDHYWKPDPARCQADIERLQARLADDDDDLDD